MLTALLSLGLRMSAFIYAEAHSPSHKHTFSVIRSYWARCAGSGSFRHSSSASFKCWYSLEAVHMGCSVNSVFEQRYFFLQGLPGRPFSILDLRRSSAVLFLKL